MLAARSIAVVRRISGLSFQPRPLNPQSGRSVLLAGWRPESCDFRVNVELARPDDCALVRDFLLREARPQEFVISSQQSTAEEVGHFFADVARRSTDTPTTALMLREDDGELIGLVAGSVNELPDVREHVPPRPPPSDMKQMIDEAEGHSRKEKRIFALCSYFFQFIPQHVPFPHKWYICGELSSIAMKYQNRHLLLPVTQLMAAYYAASGFLFADTICTAVAMRRVSEQLGFELVHEVPYEQFVDGGERCFGEPADGGKTISLMLGRFDRMGYAVARSHK
ncbi:hypothetical protein M3Y99_01736600 [Aphelenchoides fujianensis]|nr:hypothetical protein M3Y99_01736600 [Aphelenchoides fujianensis]